VGELGEIAAVVDFLLSPGAADMTGSIVSVDAGSSNPASIEPARLAR
jgi:enoyl-[acyl-carrier-protein] reductase (NADH)